MGGHSVPPMKLLVTLLLILLPSCQLGSALAPDSISGGAIQTYGSSTGFLAGPSTLDFESGSHYEGFSIFIFGTWQTGKPEAVTRNDMERELLAAELERIREEDQRMKDAKATADALEASQPDKTPDTNITVNAGAPEPEPEPEQPSLPGIGEIPPPPAGVNPTVWYALFVVLAIVLLLFRGPLLAMASALWPARKQQPTQANETAPPSSTHPLAAGCEGASADDS